jgi:AraC-like DNA-binding protein
MIFLKKYTFFFILLLIITPSVKAQNNQVDSLSKLSFEVLEKYYQESSSDSIKKKYLIPFLLKAKKNNNFRKINDGYKYFLNKYSHSHKGVQYADSIIQISKKIEDNDLIADGYLKKGIQLFYISENKDALKNYLIANDFALKNNNLFLQLEIKHYIASLKNSINEDKDALIMFKENLFFFNNIDNRVKYRKQYLKSLFSLSNSYNRNRLPDSSLVFIKLGIKESLGSPDKYLYPFFVLSYGVTKKLKGEYKIAIDSLLKGASLLKNQKKELCDSYLLLSETYYLKNEKLKSIKYLKKIDSIFNESPRVISRARKANKLLANHYQEKGDLNNQLKKILKILKIDSILKIKDKNLNKKIIKEYETPLLISKKNQIIKQLNKNNTSKKTSILVLVITTFLFLLLTLYFFRKNRINKKRFKILIQEFDSKKKLFSNKNTNLIEITTTTTTTGLSEELVKDVLNKLLIFEKSNKFIKNNYTLNSLAKELKTNSSYLSKIINNSKEGNFTNYLNKLRIEYAINKLKRDR